MKHTKAKNKKSAVKKFPTKAAQLMPSVAPQGGMPQGRPDTPLANTPEPKMMM